MRYELSDFEWAAIKPFRLTHAALVKRHVGALQDPRCIAISFAVTYEQNRHVA